MNVLTSPFYSHYLICIIRGWIHCLPLLDASINGNVWKKRLGTTKRISKKFVQILVGAIDINRHRIYESVFAWLYLKK